MWFYTFTSRPRKLPIFFQLFLQNAALQISNIEYLGILLSFYSVIFISIELSYPKIGSCRHGIVNILWFFEKRVHNILNKYSSKCSRIFSRWNGSGSFSVGCKKKNTCHKFINLFYILSLSENHGKQFHKAILHFNAFNI